MLEAAKGNKDIKKKASGKTMDELQTLNPTLNISRAPLPNTTSSKHIEKGDVCPPSPTPRPARERAWPFRGDAGIRHHLQV